MWVAARPEATVHLYLQAAPKPAGRVVGLRAVVVHEHPAVAAITEERPAEGTDIRRRGNPTGRLAIELAELLQLAILLLVQQFDAHGGGSFDYTVAEPSIQQGFGPDTISSDLHAVSGNSPGMPFLPWVMSKFLNLGYTLEQVIAMLNQHEGRLVTVENGVTALLHPMLQKAG